MDEQNQGDQHNLLAGELLCGYWDQRTENLKWFRGDWFYTVTDLPYYLYRRNWLLNRLQEAIEFDGRVVCEYGCGDAFILCYLAERFSLRRAAGVDISPRMVDLARRRVEEGGMAVDLAVVGGGTSLRDMVPSADIVLVSMVFAHNSDAQVRSILEALDDILSPEGMLVVFEHVDSQRKGGEDLAGEIAR
jgi:SAM-dependent methyltransferase